MARIEILVSGFGGQGVVRVGQILGQAAVHEGLYATMLISHGTETRGGYVRSQVVISDEFIDSPVVEHPDYFCAFSEIAYARFKGLCSRESLILHNPELVPQDPAVVAQHCAIPAEALALKFLGKEIFSNVIFLGTLSSKLTVLSQENLERALAERLPARFFEENLQAFRLGRSHHC